MQGTQPRENKMGYMPINKLLLSMAVPMMISMLVQAMYNVVDSVFVSYVGEDALTAVSLAFPIQNLMISIAVGTSVGVNALLSKSLGEKRQDAANRAADNGLFLALLGTVAFMLFGAFCSGPFFASQTKDPQIQRYGTEYLSVVCVFCFGMFFQVMLDKILISTGKTMLTMFTQGLGPSSTSSSTPCSSSASDPSPKWELPALRWPPCWARSRPWPSPSSST